MNINYLFYIGFLGIYHHFFFESLDYNARNKT